MTTRRTAERRARKTITADVTVEGVRYQETSGGTGFALGAEGGGSGKRPELPPLRGSGEARFALASEGAEEGGSKETLAGKASDVWEKHKTAILAGVAALVLIAIVRKR